MSETETLEATTRPLPDGEYAIVELFGHQVLVGRIAEVERFGAKMLMIEPLFNGELLTPVLHGGASIYRLTPCSAEIAAKEQPQHEWQLPLSIRKVVPPALLPAPATDARHADPEPDDDDPEPDDDDPDLDDEDDEDRPF